MFMAQAIGACSPKTEAPQVTKPADSLTDEDSEQDGELEFDEEQDAETGEEENTEDNEDEESKWSLKETKEAIAFCESLELEFKDSEEGCKCIQDKVEAKYTFTEFDEDRDKFFTEDITKEIEGCQKAEDIVWTKGQKSEYTDACITRQATIMSHVTDDLKKAYCSCEFEEGTKETEYDEYIEDLDAYLKSLDTKKVPKTCREKAKIPDLNDTGWDAPKKIGPTATNEFPHLALDHATGKGAMVWRTDKGLLLNTLDFTGKTGKIVNMAQATADGAKEFSRPSVAVNSKGEIAVLWINKAKTPNEIHLRHFNGTEWAAIELVSQGPNFTENLHDATVHGLGLRLDVQGKATVTWHSKTTVDTTTTSLLWTATKPLGRSDAAVWTIKNTAETVYPDQATHTITDAGPSSIVDINGTAHIVYATVDQASNDLWYTQFKDEAFTAPKKLDSDPVVADLNVQMSHSDKGTLTVLFTEGESLYVRSMLAEGWSAAKSITSKLRKSTNYKPRPISAMDPSGNAIALWTESSETDPDGTKNESVLYAKYFDATKNAWTVNQAFPEKSFKSLIWPQVTYDAKTSQFFITATSVKELDGTGAIKDSTLMVARFTNTWQKSTIKELAVDAKAPGLIYGNQVEFDANGKGYMSWIKVANGQGTLINESWFVPKAPPAP